MDFSDIPNNLSKRIEQEANIKNLQHMLNAAIKSDSLKQFEKMIENLL